MKRKKTVTIILRSCLTGRAIWIYRGPTRDAARKAYWRACKKEGERMQQLTDRIAQRAADVLRVLTECLADKPINAELTSAQRTAAKELRAISRNHHESTHEFYDHMTEIRRRRKEDHEIRRKMREREAKEKETKNTQSLL